MYTNQKSLSSQVIDKFPKGSKLDVYLIGGRDLSEQYRKTSENNFNKVVDELGKYDNLNIKVADVGAKGSPSAIVFDPKTGKLKHAVPSKVDHNTDKRIARMHLSGRELNFGFDLSKDKEIPEIIFNEKQKQKLIKIHRSFAESEGSESWKASFHNPVTRTLYSLDESCKEYIIKDLLEKKLEPRLKGRDFKKEKLSAWKEKVTRILADRTDNLSYVSKNMDSLLDKSLSSKKYGFFKKLFMLAPKEGSISINKNIHIDHILPNSTITSSNTAKAAEKNKINTKEISTDIKNKAENIGKDISAIELVNLGRDGKSPLYSNVQKSTQHTEIKSLEYKIVDMLTESILYTRDLGKDISFVCYAPEIRKSCLARQIDSKQIIDLFNEMGLGSVNKPARVSIIGGDNSEDSKIYVQTLISAMQEYDDDRNLIDIVTFDVNDKIHPDSFGFNSYSGLLYSDFIGFSDVR